jgi:osmotically-inducible protein OsmY
MRVSLRFVTLAAAVALSPLLASVQPAAAAAATAKKIADPDITVAVERQFMLDPAVPFNLIDVGTRNGVVRLSGQVADLGAKMQAERIAETVKGVRSVVDEITVAPSSLSSEEIQKSVSAALAADPATKEYALTVTADGNGIVTLRGTVDAWAERDLAAHVAAGVQGVREINNDIDTTFAGTRTDSDMQTDIKERLRWDTLVDDSLINVSVKDATATLTGVVGSAAEARRAQFDAWITGIKNVRADGLTVERWARDDDLRTSKYVHKSDQDVRKAVQAALRYDPRLNGFPMDVTVDDGIVRLTGSVGNLRAKRAASDTARNTVGVVEVENYLHVRPAGELGPQTIDRSVRDAFKRDALLNGDDIVVDVDNGIVSLYGIVDTPIEKSQAEDVASRIAGVTEVRNYLTVQNLNVAVPVPGGYGWYPYAYSVQRTDPLAEDAAIAANIDEQLYWSPFVDKADVNVSVDDGVATLTGTVTSRAERAAAVASAYEGGARRVRDEIKLAAG